MRIERLIYSVLILGASTLAILNWRRAALFKADNEELRSQVEMLQAAAESSGQLLEVTRENSQKVRSQMKELLQLRNEVTQLRNQQQKAEQLAAELEKVKHGLAQGQPAQDAAAPDWIAGDVFPKESWNFAGYATPEAAMISAIWAMKEGDRARYLESLTPREAERMIALWVSNDGGTAVDEKHRNLIAPISALRVLERQATSPTEMVMNVFIEGPGRVERVRLSQIGEEWKFGGFIREEQQAGSP